MVIPDVNQQDTKKHECFLCIFDPQQHLCHTAQLEGRIVAAYETLFEGQKTPVVTLDTGTMHVEILLDPDYYCGLVNELRARDGILERYNLTLRIYHLPKAPKTFESNGRTRSYYQANTCCTMAVLEPDILFNITDLNQAEYCSRQYILNRLIPSTISPATIRGNLVHYCFKELLKAHDRGNFDTQLETPLASLHRYLEQALEPNSLEMALANVSPDAMRAEVMPHLESLAIWYQNECNTLWNIIGNTKDAQKVENVSHSDNQVRAETFLLAPEIGLRGRLDLFWQQSGQQRLLELKTGGAYGSLPKRSHRWQVLGYHALLTVRRDSQMKKAFAILLYSGTPGHAQAFGIRPTIREIQRINETRNILALSRVSGTPSGPPSASRCAKCALLERCQHVSELLKWQPPEPDPQMFAKYYKTSNTKPFDIVDIGPLEAPSSGAMGERARYSPCPQSVGGYSNDDQEFFAKYYALLQMEERASEQQQALLWQLPVSERIQRGTAITGLEPVGQPAIDKDGWKLVFICKNTSELREGDEILLSDGNPISGEVVTGTILSINSEQVTVWTREQIAHPVLIDRYDNDLVHVRTLQNLLRWLQVAAHQRDLVAGRVRPRFIDGYVSPRSDFNAEQNLAVERAMQMQDYLLIHGPPGTGKTSVIAEIVKRLVQQGQRVMLAAFTNQAVDNMLKRLRKEGFHDYLRLGHERSVDESIRPRLLKELASVGTSDQDLVFDILSTTPVVASTTATWSSDKYTNIEGNRPKDGGLSFDVAIIDEAGQLTVPAILGALCLAKRFILVGDEKQLPPLVLSKEAAEAGLANSLFSFLKSLDEKYMQDHPLAISACVLLRTQYRMNKWIANFSSTVFYDKQLVAHKSIANRILVYAQKKGDALQALATPARQNQAIIKALEPRYPLVFLNVHDELSEQAVVEDKQSHAEARVVRDIVANLLARGIEMQDIGIIAPYRAQVATIRHHLFSPYPISDWPGLPSNASISVDTVDRFQGSERLIIIMSFATRRELSVESQRYTFLTNPNRLNVALTRAQCKLILVGCVPVLEHLPVFSRLITYCRSMKTLIDYR
jgi:DNA replication ATP-dependent helicase Dna2